MESITHSRENWGELAEAICCVCIMHCSNGFLGDLRPRLFFSFRFNLLGVFLSVESGGSESGFEGELKKSISPASSCLETQHHNGHRAWLQGERSLVNKILGQAEGIPLGPYPCWCVLVPRDRCSEGPAEELTPSGLNSGLSPWGAID